jgi:hypothetical protein
MQPVVPSSSEVWLSQLSPARQHLVAMMQDINFGWVEGLVVREGEPVLDDPEPKVFREIKFGGDNVPRGAAGAGDYALKAQVIELFQHFDRLRNGRIEVLTVKHGLPFVMHVEAAA